MNTKEYLKSSQTVMQEDYEIERQEGNRALTEEPNENGEKKCS
jgi:hypothetical protein